MSKAWPLAVWVTLAACGGRGGDGLDDTGRDTDGDGDAADTGEDTDTDTDSSHDTDTADDTDTGEDTDTDTDSGHDTDGDTDPPCDEPGFAAEPTPWPLPVLGGSGGWSGDVPFPTLAGSAWRDCDGNGSVDYAYTVVDLTGDALPDLVVTEDECEDAAGLGTSRWNVYAGTGSGFATAVTHWSLPFLDGTDWSDHVPFPDLSGSSWRACGGGGGAGATPAWPTGTTCSTSPAMAVPTCSSPRTSARAPKSERPDGTFTTRSAAEECAAEECPADRSAADGSPLTGMPLGQPPPRTT